MRLTDFARNEWSQFGEDGIIAEIFRLIGTTSKFCIEFGAADGVTCSNTKALRMQGWEALLVESDGQRYGKLQETEINAGVNSMNVEVTPENINHIIGRSQVDFISIDVDGTDYDIWEAIRTPPRVVCIEYNASIPPHVSLRQERRNSELGASALALCELAEEKGYMLVSLTKGNLIFVLKEYEALFSDYECRLESLFDPNWLCYFSTDYMGRPFVSGAAPPWGVAVVPFMGKVIGDDIELPTLHHGALREGFEDLYGPARWIPAGSIEGSFLAVEVPNDHRRNMLINILKTRGLVLIDISQHSVAAKFDWMPEIAKQLDYSVRIIPAAIVALIPNF